MSGFDPKKPAADDRLRRINPSPVATAGYRRALDDTTTISQTRGLAGIVHGRFQIGRSTRLRLDGTLELPALTAVQSHQKYHQSLSISTAANALKV